MDSLTCKICQVPYDEEDHRPRSAPCGHGLCSVCLSTVIQNKIFECPQCRQKHNVPDDLPINFCLIDIIREIKSTKNPLTNEIQSRVYGASNDEICKVHHKEIILRCLKCQMWICDDCQSSHSTFTECNPIRSSAAVANMKVEHTKIVAMQMTIYKEDASYILCKIKEHNDKIQELEDMKKVLLEKTVKHGKEIEKLHNILDEGNKRMENLEKSKIQLNETNSPYDVMDKIEVLTHRKQSLLSWSANNLGTHTSLGLSKALKGEKNVYVEDIINLEKKHGKIALYDENIYFHSLQAQKIADDSVCIPFNHLQKNIPRTPSLVFLDLSIGDDVKGRFLVRLDKTLPNIREDIVNRVIGNKYQSLKGIKLHNSDNKCSLRTAEMSSARIIDFSRPGCLGTPTPKKGDLIGYFSDVRYFNTYKTWRGDMEFYFDSAPKIPECDNSSKNKWCVLGTILNGFDILITCHNTCGPYSPYKSHADVKISDCGLVIEQE